MVTFDTVSLRDLCYYLIRKTCYSGENCAIPLRLSSSLSCFVYFLDFEMYSALHDRGRTCDRAAACLCITWTRHSFVIFCYEPSWGLILVSNAIDNLFLILSIAFSTIFFLFVQAQMQNVCHYVTWAGSQSEGHWKLGLHNTTDDYITAWIRPCASTVTTSITSLQQQSAYCSYMYIYYSWKMLNACSEYHRHLWISRVLGFTRYHC